MQKIWDGFIRFYHLLLIILMATLYFTAENDMLDQHFVAAYTLMALLLTRFIWGFIGSSNAKFSAIIHSPVAAIKSIVSSEHNPTGHTKAGSYMIWLFFLLIGAQLMTGLFTTDDIMTDGPLVASASSDWVETASDWHRDAFDYILIAIGIHIAAIVFYRIKGKNLITAMITGKRETDKDAPTLKPAWWAFAVFAVLWAIIFWLWGWEVLMAIV